VSCSVCARSSYHSVDAGMTFYSQFWEFFMPIEA
jgi:hypothetical protein